MVAFSGFNVDHIFRFSYLLYLHIIYESLVTYPTVESVECGHHALEA